MKFAVKNDDLALQTLMSLFGRIQFTCQYLFKNSIINGIK